ncbi:inhibin beta A chain [Scaptodrosophila lebanonensis]|uniref:Inhibin beta A chain n=1 Tax=Drosophila lebanonensis TaxID=7225 RepID=A0A6J2TLV3_DROLE|nr:inhibin beta A chain [Scaptodrosophila lebanonensis]XP_030377557.1 inhibin beta A chain [Scaptodrosophila lebanonensis]
MAQYFMTFMLLLCLALENDNIYNRLHARSHPSAREDSEGVGVHLMRQHQQYQQLQRAHHHASKLQTPPQQQHHTKHQRTRQPKHMAPDPNEEEDAAAIQLSRYYARLRRHLRHQREHELQQQRSYHRSGSSRRPVFEELKSVPRLWQHLSDVYYDDEQEDTMNQRLSSAEQDYSVMVNDAPETDTQQKSEASVDELDELAYVKNQLMQSSFDAELPPAEPEAAEVSEVSEEPSPLPILNATIPNSMTNSTNKTTGGCPKCESNRQVEHITEEELTRLRIEFVKQQILEKLRLKESPNVSAVELPKPIFEGVTLTRADEGVKSKDLDDYYAKTNKKFIFLKREHHECNRLNAHPSMCFSFKIDDADADGFDVSTAVLWLFKNKRNATKQQNETLSMPQQTIVVSEVEQQLDNKYLPLAKTIAIQTVDVQDEWMKIDIEWPIKRWFGNHDLSHIVQITCESCDIESMEEIISVDKDYRPFIMIDTQNRRTKSRQKRSINCADGVTECCREKLYISFADIGWSNWILQPAGYDAYFCRGSCSSVASVTQAASHHSSLLKILSASGTRKPLELVPCCTAKQYSSLQLVVLDSNNSATLKTLPNMVVESCGCR